MTDKLHTLFTVDDGIHIVQAWSLANYAARAALSPDLLPADIGRVAYVAEDSTFWVLADDDGGEGPVWKELTFTVDAGGDPQTIGTANSAGTSEAFAREDHVHSHGNLLGGALHADVVAGVSDGFMTAELALFSPLLCQILHGSPLPGTPTVFGPIPAAGVIGTATARVPDNTNYTSRKFRVGYVSAASANASALALFYSAYAGNTGYFSRETGFALKTACVLAVVNSTYTWLLGLGITSDFSMATPSARTNTVFVGADGGDTNAQLMYNDAAGSCTKVDLGANFPARTAGDMFELFLWCLPGNATINYVVTRHSSAGAVFTASGTVTGANVPAAGTQWYPMTGCGTVTASSVAIDSLGFYAAIPH